MIVRNILTFCQLIHQFLIINIVTLFQDIEPGNESKLPVVNDEHDGGYGWVVVFGAFMVQITTFGVISSW